MLLTSPDGTLGYRVAICHTVLDSLSQMGKLIIKPGDSAYQGFADDN